MGSNYQVFGTYKIPEGYELAYVPPNAVIEPVSLSGDSTDQSPIEKSEYKLSSVYSFASALVSIIQITYALTGLYRSRGDQVSKYGYAAFSFTVLPYVIMSFVNLLGNLVTPRYSTLYLVRTEMMDEASRRGGEFQGIVGNLQSTHLEVEDTFVFSATLKDSSQERWELQLAENIYLSGEVEPMTAEKEETAIEPDEEHAEAALPASDDPKETLSIHEGELTVPVQSCPSHETTEKQILEIVKSKEDKKPLLICPNCYQFKSIEESRSKFFSPSNPKQYHLIGKWLVQIVRISIAALPLAVIGGMSQFKIGSSTVAQRAWTMSWLAVGMGLPFHPLLSVTIIRDFTGLVDNAGKMARKEADARTTTLFFNYVAESVGYIIGLGLVFAPAIGGFFVVAQMLKDSASCEVI